MSTLPDPVAHAASLPHDINFVGQSPHVFSHRLWFRRPYAGGW